MDHISHHAVIRYLGLKGLTPKEVYEDMVVTLGKNVPSYSVVKKWDAEFKRGSFIWKTTVVREDHSPSAHRRS